ncbi:sulfurtransferase [Naumannella halotolerans]|uniref:sulfurtransferase n=1 Tax=Naumannella halotolerans TaxID=993414 RepID=UPI00370D56E8
MSDRERVLIEVEELLHQLGSGSPPVLLDVRWTLGGPSGHGDYLAGHIPGAVFVDLDTELAAHGEPTEGRHPLPSVADLQAAARRWGIDDDSSVVVYDGGGNLAAARAWWLLRWAGLSRVRLLDGALPAWQAAGGPLETGEVVPEPGRVELSEGHVPSLDLDQVAEVADTGVLLDARAGERYRGETEPMDPKAGHVPGALSAPTSENLTADGRFRDPQELQQRFDALGVGPGTEEVAVYCGSGVYAAHEVAALASIGVSAALYPGSWSQWSNHDLPVATGPHPR